jgi:hypothetical protein
MCKYYLVSNSIHLNEELFNTLNIEDNHNIILFNHSYPLKFINHKNKILFIRETDKVLTGIENDLTHYKKVYFFITSDKSYFSDKFEKLNLLKINYEIININDFIKDNHPEYPENNLPTCGFLGYLYLTKNNKYNIYNDINNFFLVGFTGHHSNGHDYNGIEHNYIYEQIYYKKNNVTILLKK